jgi:surface polysaccharide O-acyltransferase-like enzyme
MTHANSRLSAKSPHRELWIDYLRSFIIILVVAHHSALAYIKYAHFNKKAYILSTAPVVDVQNWIGLNVLVSFNDIFFMALMFFISGLFVFRTIQNRGGKLFLWDRFKRLFIPFIVGVTILSPIAYYPSYLLAHGNGNVITYLVDFITVEGWPGGPSWFIWLLFLFDILIALIITPLAGSIVKLGECCKRLMNKPFLLLLIVFAITWIIYVPFSMLFGAYGWMGIGPFHVQKNRILLYFVYFIFGVIAGSTAHTTNSFDIDSMFVKRWKTWICLSPIVFFIFLVSYVKLTDNPGKYRLTDVQVQSIVGTIWVASCVLSCSAFLSTFKKITKQNNKFLDSLSPCSFGIYLIHYIMVTWCQFALMQFALVAWIKFAITLIFAFFLSWAISWAIKKNTSINSVI